MMMMMMVTRHPRTSRGSGEREFQVGFTTGMQITAAIACENTSTRVEFRFPTPTKFLDQGFGGGHRGRRRVPRRHKGPDLGRDSEPRVPPSCSLSSFTFPCHLAHPQPAFSTLLVLLLLLFPLLQPQRFDRRRCRRSRRCRLSLSCSAFVTFENSLVLLVCTVTVL